MPAVDEVLAIEHQHRAFERRHAAQRVEPGERAHRLPAVAADLELGGVDAVHPRLRGLHRRMLGIVLSRNSIERGAGKPLASLGRTLAMSAMSFFAVSASLK